MKSSDTEKKRKLEAELASLQGELFSRWRPYGKNICRAICREDAVEFVSRKLNELLQSKAKLSAARLQGGGAADLLSAGDTIPA